MKAVLGSKRFQRLLAKSHERQFAGEDWQAVAISIAECNGIEFEDEEYKTLCSAPDPGCDCGYCGKADWQD